MKPLNLGKPDVSSEGAMARRSSLLSIVHNSRYRSFFGRLLQVVASLLPITITLLYLYAVYYVVRKCPVVSGYTLLGITVLGIVAIFFGIQLTPWIDYLSYMAKRLREKNVETVLARDPRDLVLYLRSFMHEIISTHELSPDGDIIYSPSDEEAIREVVEEVGPLIAIGQPGEILPPIGAARLYLAPGDDWQNIVTDYLGKAQFVIINAEYTKGILWELATAFHKCRPERIIISFSAIQRSVNPERAYLRFKEALHREAKNHKILVNLPDEIGRSAFMYYDDSLMPKLTDPDNSIWVALAQIFVSKGIKMNLSKFERKLIVGLVEGLFGVLLFISHCLLPALIIILLANCR